MVRGVLFVVDCRCCLSVVRRFLFDFCFCLLYIVVLLDNWRLSFVVCSLLAVGFCLMCIACWVMGVVCCVSCVWFCVFLCALVLFVCFALLLCVLFVVRRCALFVVVCCVLCGGCRLAVIVCVIV